MSIRLDKYLSDALQISRKEARALILKGVVFVNEKRVLTIGFPIDENFDLVTVDGQKVIYQKFFYFLLNKPTGYLSATTDQFTPTVISLFPGYERAKLFPVGRLDKDTTGTLLVTNHGTLAHRLTNPKYNIEKEYFVTVNFPLKNELILAFAEGIVLEDNLITRPAKLTLIDAFHARLIITEGKFHQVKRMFKYFGYEVLSLERIRFANLSASDLEVGTYRFLTKEEISSLFQLVSLEMC
ncbi:MAG: pseudouridine synthase [Bacilli bacterium]|jgi:16S rRNA pseudouridine516 synthase